jgi:addiction module HigA family antidote
VAADTTPQADAGKFDELVAATIRTAVDEWRIQNDPADYHGVSMPEYIRSALATAGLLAPFSPDWSIHPGEILREELKARGLTQHAFAEKAGRSVQVINLIINGKKGITPDTALDLERGLGVSAGFWVRLQAEHDLAVARQRRAGRVS